MVPIEFQSTHPHGVRPLSMHIYKYNDRVSIHAPTRGATQCRLQHQRIWLVSIHAPTRGATSSALRNISVSAFQSTHPHGVRLTKTEVLRQYRTFQSTHPHGVRQHKSFSSPSNYRFQSTHPHGVRPTGTYIKTDRILFQSTHPHGVRPQPYLNKQEPLKFQSTHPHGVRPQALSRHRPACHCFNPRTHTGCDEASSISFHISTIAGVSIHAPTRGATTSG